MGQVQPEPFRRPVFRRIFQDLKQIAQILSITGPRRVGKTTLVRQLIQELLREGLDPSRIVYFSMDDPLLLRDPYRERFFDLCVRWLDTRTSPSDGPLYLFLDEIQRYEHWELFLKKYHDLNFPFRFVISGSASSPIFKKSRESLLGRVKDFHVLPFSFKEFVLFQRRADERVIACVSDIEAIGEQLRQEMLLACRNHPRLKMSLSLSGEVESDLRHLLQRYLVDGGFPEVWQLPDLVRKQEYLFDNQIQKVIFEDLVLATEFRKPENIKAFYLSLIEQPGQELNLEKASGAIGVSRPMLEKYFPLLEMTDLVKRLPKFSKRVMKLRRGNVKCYLVDLALRNAVLKVGDRVLSDPTMLGYYAENLVFNTLRAWPGIVNLSFYREKGHEVDFVVTLSGGHYLPVEVKYRQTPDDFGGIKSFLERYDQPLGLVVVREPVTLREANLVPIPLHHFLLIFG